jgi:hypothetical protein
MRRGHRLSFAFQPRLVGDGAWSCHRQIRPCPAC